MLGIPKRGNTYLRTQLINGAIAALRHRKNKNDQVSLCAKKLKERSDYNNTTVALAKKMGRISYGSKEKKAGLIAMEVVDSICHFSVNKFVKKHLNLVKKFTLMHYPH